MGIICYARDQERESLQGETVRMSCFCSHNRFHSYSYLSCSTWCFPSSLVIACGSYLVWCSWSTDIVLRPHDAADGAVRDAQGLGWPCTLTEHSLEGEMWAEPWR